MLTSGQTDTTIVTGATCACECAYRKSRSLQ